MSCNFGQTKVGTSLKRMTGSDSGYFNALQSLVTNVVKDSNGTEYLQFTDGFVKYYQNLYKTDKVPVVENSERGKIAHAIIDYYLSKHFDVEAQSEIVILKMLYKNMVIEVQQIKYLLLRTLVLVWFNLMSMA